MPMKLAPQIEAAIFAGRFLCEIDGIVRGDEARDSRGDGGIEQDGFWVSTMTSRRPWRAERHKLLRHTLCQPRRRWTYRQSRPWRRAIATRSSFRLQRPCVPARDLRSLSVQGSYDAFPRVVLLPPATAISPPFSSPFQPGPPRFIGDAEHYLSWWRRRPQPGASLTPVDLQTLLLIGFFTELFIGAGVEGIPDFLVVLIESGRRAVAAPVCRSRAVAAAVETCSARPMAP